MEKTYYISKEQFTTLTTTWANTKDHSAWQHIIYNILRDKPADLGFTQKTKNIQGNNPWYAFNNALSLAEAEINPSRAIIKKWGVVEKGLFGSKSGWIEQPNPHYKSFKDLFGIDMPADFLDKLKAIPQKRAS